MLRRTGFKRKVYAPPPAAPVSRPARWGVNGLVELVAPIPKENALQHAGYMDLVRDLPCIRCGRPPRSQFCHADESKGMGIKTDCRRGWPGCAACHHLVGSTGALGQAGRRLFELEAGCATRATIIAAGKWPNTLPMYEEPTHDR